MSQTSLLVIGGFLGSGKTTSILSIAKQLIQSGKKVGIVTNDQGSQLVDTNFLIQSGLPVLEVTGGCFCCNFEEFTKKVNELTESLMPDIVLAEPVGSCTDLVATIFKPIQQKFTKQFCLKPLSIVVDPKRVKKLMMEEEGSSLFPSEINYLFRKQLEEADVIVLNKIDTLSEKQISSISSFLKEKFKGTEVITVSAKEEKGINDWTSMLLGFEHISKSSLDIDYDKYAKAEEYLGWFNSTNLIKSSEPHNANEFIEYLMNEIRRRLSSRKFEIAHLKVYEIAGADWAKASLTSIFDEVDFNKRMDFNVSESSLIINARINTNPEELGTILADALSDTALKFNLYVSSTNIESFKPGRPNPKYRIK